MKKVKVLMVGNDFSVHGGITTVIQQLLSFNWQQENIAIDFIPTYIQKNFILKVAFFSLAYLKIKKYLKVERPDIVHIHMSYKGSFTRALLIYELSRKYGAKVIVHLHGSEFKKWYDNVSNTKKRKIRKFLQEIDTLIVLGNKWKNKILTIEPLTKITVVSNSINIPVKTTNLNDDSFNVLFLGVLIPRKGVSVLIKAIALLKRQNKLGKIRLVIAGDGPEKENLCKKVRKLNLQDDIKFIGWINDQNKDNLFINSQLFVLPSYNEGLSMSVLEAISYGLPVISTDVGDMSSAVINGKNGFTLKPGDFSTLANRIFDIASNRAMYLEMSKFSRKLAEKKFSSEGYFNLILKSYKQCLS